MDRRMELLGYQYDLLGYSFSTFITHKYLNLCQVETT